MFGADAVTCNPSYVSGSPRKQARIARYVSHLATIFDRNQVKYHQYRKKLPIMPP